MCVAPTGTDLKRKDAWATFLASSLSVILEIAEGRPTPTATRSSLMAVLRLLAQTEAL